METFKSLSKTGRLTSYPSLELRQRSITQIRDKPAFLLIFVISNLALTILRLFKARRALKHAKIVTQMSPTGRIVSQCVSK